MLVVHLCLCLVKIISALYLFYIPLLFPDSSSWNAYFLPLPLKYLWPLCISPEAFSANPAPRENHLLSCYRNNQFYPLFITFALQSTIVKQDTCIFCLPLQHPPIHSSIFIQCLLCVKYCLVHWESSRMQKSKKFLCSWNFCFSVNRKIMIMINK